MRSAIIAPQVRQTQDTAAKAQPKKSHFPLPLFALFLLVTGLTMYVVSYEIYPWNLSSFQKLSVAGSLKATTDQASKRSVEPYQASPCFGAPATQVSLAWSIEVSMHNPSGWMDTAGSDFHLTFFSSSNKKVSSSFAWQIWQLLRNGLTHNFLTPFVPPHS